MAPLRQALDAAGGAAKLLVLALDGSFCNRTCFRAPRQRTELIARARKDARLCFRAPQPSRRFYDLSPFTPEQVRQDESRPWQQTKLFYGGKRRRIRYKEVTASLLADRRRPDSPAPLRRGSHSLSQTEKFQALLPPARLSALHRPAPLRSPVAANLLRPLADRSQPPRREGYPGRGTSSVVEHRRRPQTARPGRGRLQRPAPGRAPSLRHRTRRKPIRPCPSGDARPTALPASTSSPCCAKKWSTTPKAPNPWASNSPTATSPTPPTPEICRNSRAVGETHG